jgi:hypothetical protein
MSWVIQQVPHGMCLNCVQTLHTCLLMQLHLAKHVKSIPRAAAARCTFNVRLHVTAMHLKLQCRSLLQLGSVAIKTSLFQQRSMCDVMRCVRYRQATSKHAVFAVCKCASALVLGHC